MRRAPRRTAALRATLLCASALGGSLLLTPTAQAQAVCDPVSPTGVISCGAGGSPYGAIDYTGLSGGRTLVLENGVTAASVLFTGTGALTVSAADADIVTTADAVSGIDVNSADGGVVTVTAGDIATSGAASHGIHAETQGALNIISGSIHTLGENARGIMVSEETSGEVTIHSTTILTEGALATGISLGEELDPTPLGTETTGMAFKVVGGDITTRGADARGIVVNAYGNLDIGAQAIVTEGFRSTGIDLRGANVTARAQTIQAAGEQALGVQVHAGGDAVIEVGSVTTAGSQATAIWLDAGGDANIKVATIRTARARSRGIDAFAEGDLTVEADGVRTMGAEAAGVRVSAHGDATAKLGFIDATGSGADAVWITALGAVKLDVARRLGSASGAAAILNGHSVELNVAADAVIEGGEGGLVVVSETTTTIANAGSISTASGYVIQAEAGATTLNNTGRVRGNVLFADQADVINNSGRFEAEGVSEFGGGQDVFNNAAGGVFVASDSSEPVSTRLSGLETFNNAGTIDLANGIAGDVLTLSGALNSTAGSHIRLDVDLSGPTPVADRVNAATLGGTSVLQVQVEGTGALGDTGVTLIGSGGPQTGQEFTVETIGGGFVDYDIAYDATAHTYQLVGALADQAFEPTKVASGAQTQWRRGADVVSARLADLRDTRDPGRDRQVWAQAYGGRDSIGGRNGVTTEDVDLSHDVHVSGLAIGADLRVDLAGGQAIIGAVGGAGRTELTFLGNGDVSEFKSLSIGAYGQWVLDRFALAGLVKGEFHDMRYVWASAEVSDQADGETWGMQLETTYRFGDDGWFVEPAAGLAWNTTDLDGIADDAGSVAFGDTVSLTGKLGVRAGWRIALESGATIQPYGGVYLHREFDGDNVSTLTFGSTVVEVADEGRRGWGEVVLGANVQTASGWGGFAQAEILEGDVEGYAGRVGVRLAW